MDNFDIILVSCKSRSKEDIGLIEKEELEVLTKDELGEWLQLEPKEIRKQKKHELVEELWKKVKDNDIHKRKLYNECKIRLAYHPSKVEERLEITKTERKRWTEEQRLVVAGYDSFHKWGSTHLMPLYDKRNIDSITEETLQKWREQHQEEVKEKRKKGIQKAQETRISNREKVRSFYEEEWKTLMKEWHKTSFLCGSTLQLAFWTMWVNRWAKEYQLKAKKAIKKTEEYTTLKEECYGLKEEALHLLQHNPYTTISFYRPDYPDKITHLEFCHQHYELWCDLRQGWYMDKWEFYHGHAKEIHKCKGCEVKITEDYYSLYVLEVQEPSSEMKFSFHVPFPIGRHWIGNYKTLPQVQHVEQEGIFRFGRTLFEDEKVVFPYQKTKNMFQEAYDKLEQFSSQYQKISK